MKSTGMRFAAVLLVFSAVLGAGCRKEHESLIVAQLTLATPDDRGTNLESITLAPSPGTARTFASASLSLSADTTLTLGLYVGAGVTGPVSVVATAAPRSGCIGFRGNNTVTIGAAGETKPVAIVMTAAVVCGTDGGAGDRSEGGGGDAGGAGGTASGTGGMTGIGGGGGRSGSGTGGSGAGGAGTGTAGMTGIGGVGGRGGSGAGGAATGTGGMTGIGGGGGRGGSGAGGTNAGGAGPIPSLATATCREFDHNPIAGCAGGSTQVTGVAISPDGSLVATAGSDGRIKIWLFNGHTLTTTTTTLTGYSDFGIAFSPDGTRLAAVSGTSIRQWTTSNWVVGVQLLGDGSNNTFIGVGFTPDSRRIVSIDHIGFAGGTMYVHDVAGNGFPAFTQHIIDEPRALAVSPRVQADGSASVVVTSWYTSAATFSLGASGFSLYPVIGVSAMSSAVPTVQFTPDGSLFATAAGDSLVRFWSFPSTMGQVSSGTDIRFGGDANALAVSPRGNYIVVGGTFGNPLLSTFNMETRATLARYVPTYDIDSLAISPSGAAIVAGEDDCGKVLVCAD